MMDDGHTLVWSIDGARFELQVAGEVARLCLPDGQLIDLSNREWAGLARAIGMVVASAAPVAKPVVKRSHPVEKGSNAGVRWTS